MHPIISASNPNIVVGSLKKKKKKERGRERESESANEDREEEGNDLETTHFRTILMLCMLIPIVFSIIVSILESSSIVINSSVFPPALIIMRGKQQIVPPEDPMHLAAMAREES